ncbi:MAG: phosphate ABC transporter permease subunit PstC [Campylobacterota bacterium]|nr:phosphate ABC transporter permease subunit PstC [Campylobacterota bacterium]
MILNNVLILTLLVLLFYYLFQNKSKKFKDRIEKGIEYLLILSALISIAILTILEHSILYYSTQFFANHSIWYFFTGTQWSADSLTNPQFGALPLFVGTVMIALIAISVALPIGLFCAIYLSQFAPTKAREIIKPILEILAGIPTIVYGFFAAASVAPFVVSFFGSMGVEVSYSNALSSGIVLGIMIIPMITSLIDDVMGSVPSSYTKASFSLGLTKSETILFIILPVASPAIIAVSLLGISRALGETMIVLMAAGLRPNLTLNPLEDMTTVTIRIVDAFSGDQSFSSAETLSAFALGFALFIFTLLLNTLSIYLIKRFQKRYQYSNL